MNAVNPRADEPNTSELMEILSGLGFRPGRFKLMFEIGENGAVSSIHDHRCVPESKPDGWDEVFTTLSKTIA